MKNQSTSLICDSRVVTCTMAFCTFSKSEKHCIAEYISGEGDKKGFGCHGCGSKSIGRNCQSLRPAAEGKFEISSSGLTKLLLPVLNLLMWLLKNCFQTQWKTEGQPFDLKEKCSQVSRKSIGCPYNIPVLRKNLFKSKDTLQLTQYLLVLLLKNLCV